MEIVHLNGATLVYEEHGSGEPVVLVHGSASDYRTWHLQMENFASQYRTIVYSRRYHWPNAPIPDGGDYSMLEHVEDLGAVLEALDIAPAHLVGHSYGAFVSLLLAIQAPHLVRTLVLAEPPVVPLFVSLPPKPLELLRLALRKPRTAAAIVHFGATGLEPATAAFRRGDVEAGTQRFGRAVLGRDAFAQLSEARREQVRANIIPAEFLGSGLTPVEAARVRTVQCPTLLLGGEQSPSLFPRLLDGLEELLPHPERVRIPGASHMMQEDNASAFNDAVLAFLARHRASPASADK